MQRPFSFTRITADGEASPVARDLAEEVPVAIEFNGVGYAVLMATPADVAELVQGFALTERLVIPSDAPPEVLATVDKIWAEKVMNSPELKTYAETFGAVFAPSYGPEARALAMPVVILEACSSLARGEAVNDPSTIGIDCETRTEVGAQ